jgi:hypothetical protein
MPACNERFGVRWLHYDYDDSTTIGIRGANPADRLTVKKLFSVVGIFRKHLTGVQTPVAL